MFKISIFLPMLFSICLSSQQTATTQDGKKVILLDNFTWKYASQSDLESTDNQGKDNMSPAGDIAKSQNDPENRNNQSNDNRLSLVDIVKNDTSFDFRKVRWGMGKQQVRASESGKFLKGSSDSLQYELEFLGYTCTISYMFANDKLTKAVLLIEQPHVDPALYYKDYENLKNYLSPIYKNKVSERCDWQNEMYKSDKSKWGFAVSIGFLTCQTQWKNARTAIVLEISGGNHEISTRIEYINGTK
jgi:hypothetical protein